MLPASCPSQCRNPLDVLGDHALLCSHRAPSRQLDWSFSPLALDTSAAASARSRSIIDDDARRVGHRLQTAAAAVRRLRKEQLLGYCIRSCAGLSSLARLCTFRAGSARWQSNRPDLLGRDILSQLQELCFSFSSR